ncbi:hypothetical protein BZ13_1187 [Francisella philomiragia subsp. philomiragia ATCC 25015]|nr:hypothetical protein BZ13_1187 [Francisella philomiragia subsp. philomiragia ATCC 25015]
MLKFFKSLFLTNKMHSHDIQKYIKRLQNISNSYSEYASNINDSNKYKMINEIESIESKIKDIEDIDLYYNLAIAYRNYSAWYIRGNNRKFFLEKSIEFLEKSSPDNINSFAELGRILIDEKLVRDLPRGINILKELSQKNKLPDYLNSVLSKAERQNNNLKENETFSLLRIAKDPSPAVFREERKRFRALITKQKKKVE